MKDGGVTRVLTVPATIVRPRLQVCFVTETYTPEINGVAMTLQRLVNGLRDRRHEVRIVRPRPPDTELSDSASDDLETLVRGAPVPGYRSVRIGTPAWRQLRACWAARRPDVVYVATPGPLGWAAVHTANRLRIPLLSGFHTDFPSYVRHYGLAAFARGATVYLRWLHNRTDGTVVPTLDLLERLCDEGFENLMLLGRGVDSRVFSPGRRDPSLRAAWGARPTELVVLYVGRLAREKNVALAIEAFRAMRQVGAVRHLVIVGDGPLRAELQATHPDVRFCGPQRGALLAAHYASADVFLFPSETETFGNVVLEAMASGLAVVAFDYAAARVHISSGETGVLVPRGDRRGFIAAAVTLAGSPSDVARLRRAARSLAVLLDWEAVIDRFETLLIDAVAAWTFQSVNRRRRRSREHFSVSGWSAGTSSRGGGAVW